MFVWVCVSVCVCVQECGCVLLYEAFVHGQTDFAVPKISLVKFARQLVK